MCSCSTGSNASPEIADHTPHELELRIISEIYHACHFLRRFRDDIFMVYIGTNNELTDFVHTINELHATFKFSFGNSQQSVTFLDVEIFKGPRYDQQQIIDLRTHTKQTDTFQYLHRESCHPTATFKWFVKGEILRYACTCNKVDFDKKTKFFTNELMERGYNEN